MLAKQERYLVQHEELFVFNALLNALFPRFFPRIFRNELDDAATLVDRRTRAISDL